MFNWDKERKYGGGFYMFFPAQGGKGEEEKEGKSQRLSREKVYELRGKGVAS